MTDQATARKITVSLPNELVDYADQQAEKQNISRSHVISQALERVKLMEEEQLAIEGYQFFAQEAEEFAATSAAATAEAFHAMEGDSDAG